MREEILGVRAQREPQVLPRGLVLGTRVQAVLALMVALPAMHERQVIVSPGIGRLQLQRSGELSHGIVTRRFRVSTLARDQQPSQEETEAQRVVREDIPGLELDGTRGGSNGLSQQSPRLV